MDKETIFWNWFDNNKHIYEKILINVSQLSQEDIDIAMDLFESNLHSYEEYLWFRMGGTNPFELIITAEGNKAFFPMVEKLVDNSPEIENWIIIPFIQPTNLFNFHYRKDDYELSDGDIYFSYSEDSSGINGYFLEVMFYVEDAKFIDDDGFKSSIIRISESALGEYDFATIIGFIDVVKKSTAYPKHESGLLPIHKLTEVSEAIKQKL